MKSNERSWQHKDDLDLDADDMDDMMEHGEPVAVNGPSSGFSWVPVLPSCTFGGPATGSFTRSGLIMIRRTESATVPSEAWV